MGNALASVLDRAKASADEFQPTDNALIPASAPASQALSAPSLDGMADGQGISVDEFLKVDKAGFQLGKMTKYFDTFVATLDLSDVIPIYSVRASKEGVPTKFIKSYDGVSTSTGENFQQAIAQLRSSYTKVDGPTQTSEIPMTLTEDVTDGSVTVPAGTTVGLTPSVTGAKPWGKFYKSLREAGRGKDEVNVKLTCVARVNSNNQRWGVAEFELLD